MRIWSEPYTLEHIRLYGANLPAHLGMEFIELGDDYIRARLPVDGRTRQPFGILHGGASVALAETLGSTGAGLVIVALYVVVARVYPDRLRPRVFSAISAAWVLPAVVGPVLAGWVAQQLSWRWVFLGAVPLVAFPVAHGDILGALYLPVAAMLVGLMLRGVAFELRIKAEGWHRELWNWLFWAGSTLASFSRRAS